MGAGNWGTNRRTGHFGYTKKRKKVVMAVTLQPLFMEAMIVLQSGLFVAIVITHLRKHCWAACSSTCIMPSAPRWLNGSGRHSGLRICGSQNWTAWSSV